MVRPREVGPDLPSGLRRPGRSVSLPSEPPLPPMVDPRKAAAATGGAIWFYGGYGNPPQKQMGPNRWGAAEGEYQKLADAVQKTAAEVGEAVDSADPEEVMNWLGEEPTWVEITPDGTVVSVPEPDPEAWVPDPGAVPEVVPEVVPPAVGGSLLAQGLTADEAFQQHQATSGVGAMAGAGAMAGMNAARRINPNQGELPGTGGPAEEIRRQIEEARKKIPSRTPAEEAAWEKALREGGQRVPAPVVPPPVPPPVSQMAGPDEWWNTVPGLEDLSPEFEEPYPEGNFPEEEWSQRHNPNIHRPNRLPPQDEVLNPELRSMDSQMLADMMAQQATQPEQGWLGGALGGVGGFLGGTLSQMQGNTTLPYAQQAQGQLNAFQNMSTEQKIAIVLTGLAYAAGTSGVGGPAVPPLLGGAALLNATG